MITSGKSVLRRLAFAGATLAVIAAAGALQPARAAYPDRNVTVIIPFSVGGLSDVEGRLVAAGLTRELGQTVVVENRAGAGGNVGIADAMRAKPDGYTVLLSSIGMTTNPALYKNLSWDPAKVQPVALLITGASSVGVNTKRFPKGNLLDLVAQIKKEPGKFNFASSDSTINENLFKMATGVTIEIVNYNGAGDGATALANGEADVDTTGVIPLIPLVSSGRIRILAVTGSHRVPALPDVPTTTEAGLPGYNPVSYLGAYVPKGTPADIVTRLNAAFNKVMGSADIKDKLLTMGADANISTVKQAEDFFTKDIQTYKEVVKRGNIPTLD